MYAENSTLALTLKVKDNLIQADLERWELDIRLDAPTVKRRASVLIGAINAGIIIEPMITIDTLLEWGKTPNGTQKIQWFGKMLTDLYVELITLPPN